MGAWLVEFWNANSGSIIASLIAGFVFFVLGPIGLWFSGRRIRQERIRKAKEMLVDLLEGMLVNQEVVTSDKLTVLFHAVQREIDVQFETAYDIERLLEDVMLRFHRSRHLAAGQKNEYAERLQTLSRQIHEETQRSSRRPLPRQMDKIFNDLRSAIDGNDKKRSLTIAGELEMRLLRTESEETPSFFNPFRAYIRLYRRNPSLFIVVGVVFMVLYIVFLRYVILN